MPPIAEAFTPTLASGDASELLPPLLAPQGWAGCTSPAVGAADYAALTIHSRGIGGCFITADFDLATVPVYATLSDAVDPTWVSTATLTVMEESPGVLSTLDRGYVTAIASGDVPSLYQERGADPMPWYVPSGKFLTFVQGAVLVPIICNIHIRDVPAGIAPD
jgi:hypothetical protein